MLRGLYIAATGMLAQRKRMDVITNNITNVDTVGYKRDEVILRDFDDVLTIRLREQNPFMYNTAVGPLTYGVYVDTLQTEHTQGPIDVSERKADFAIEGDGFFVVQTPNGERYTRAGNFNVNDQGWLLTNEGYFVMGEDGPINVGTGENYVVTSDGTIYIGEQNVGRMLIVAFQDPTMLRKEGDNLHNNDLGSPMIAPAGRVLQGALEMSNANIGVEMTELIQLNRIFEANQRMVQTVDGMMQKTVNEVGTV